jgi:hypothetical protein
MPKTAHKDKGINHFCGISLKIDEQKTTVTMYLETSSIY